MKIKQVIVYQNPKVDFLFGSFGGIQIPTKQDKFKPIEVTGLSPEGIEVILNNCYMKNPESQSILDFNKFIQDLARKSIPEENKIMKPNLIEIILSISMTKNRFNEVDVDNLAKSILDSLNNIAYEDDSQISSLICSKYIHPTTHSSILIGITKLTSENLGFTNEIKLIRGTPW